MKTTDFSTIALIMIIFVVFLCVILFYYSVVIPFLDERNYIKQEMEKSCGSEYEHWRRKLKEFYISRIPILGNIFLKFFH